MARHRPDPFAKPATPRYLIVWDLEWHALECECLDSGMDLHTAVSDTIERLRIAGWHPEGTTEFGFVFMRRNTERRLLMLTARDPRTTSQQSFCPFR
jgi:hypothetical protein